ncbi:MAG: xylulokinase [Eubacteriales bacterium]|nr:xylulokinase [Eubacteriales bacterium]
MNNTCIVGIDVGTSGVKVLALDQTGQILSSIVESYPLYQPQTGWTEQDPSDWWTATVKALKAMMQTLGDFQIAAIGLSGQMHGMVALDSSNRVVRRAILWNDQRTGPQCEAITEAAGGLTELLKLTNNQMLTGYTGGKIAWLKAIEPDNYAKTVLVINPKDYIRFRLSGALCTDVSDASGFGFYDVANNVWSDSLIAKAGLKRSLFPEVVESGAITGQVTLEAATETSLPQGIPVVGGGGDAVISTTGLGLIKPGRVAVTLGTSGVVAMGLPRFMDNPQGSLQVFRGNAPDTFTAMGVTLAAAGSYHWFRNALGRYESAVGKEQGVSAFKLLDDEAAAVAAGSDGLIFMPYLNGERCPINDSNARGGFVGLTSQHEMGHFARAVLEGVAFSMRQVYELIKSENGDLMASGEVVLAGGGAASDLWRQIFADVFNMPVRTVYGSAEGGSFGAALVAGVAVGVWPSLEATVLLIKPESETQPIAAHVARYEQAYATYCKLYDALKWI